MEERRRRGSGSREEEEKEPRSPDAARDEAACGNKKQDSGTERKRKGRPKEMGSFGILRTEGTPRGLLSPQKVEPSSPQPSIDRLSVTFAIAEEGEPVDRPGEDPEEIHESPPKNEGTMAKNALDLQRSPTLAVGEGEDGGEEDDYSASVCAIMQRRTSSRRHSRRKRRSSSPFGPEGESTLRRRSSAFTTSSGDTAISIEEGGTQEQIFEKLKLHKEVLSGVKQQPWPLRRKIKLVQQAKSYVRRHEGALQERLAQSRSTRDAIARASILVSKKWQYFKREFVNLQTWLVPWELRIKEIESHFGSAVASYFIFLRWLFWINLVISATLMAFVAVPEMLTADASLAGERKIMLPEETAKSKHLLTLWEFEGILKYSPFFYGWYTNVDSKTGYRLPLAYFVANLVVYTYSFVAILRKMAENSRMSKLSEKEDECAFSWKLFTGWDFMIGNPETAHNRCASIILGFKEALLEEAERQKAARNWKITTVRVFVNISVMTLLALSAYAVVEVVARSTEPEADSTWWRQNEITVVMSLISYIFPIFFEILGIFERYHPRKQLRVQLARIMVLNLLNLYSLIFALFDKISDMEIELQSLKPKTDPTTWINCTKVLVPCSSDFSESFAALASLSLVLSNAISKPKTEDSESRESETSAPYNSSSPVENSTASSIFNATEDYFYDPGDVSLDYDYLDHVDVSLGPNITDIFGNNNFTWLGGNFTATTEIFNSTLGWANFTYSEILENYTTGSYVSSSGTSMNDLLNITDSSRAYFHNLSSTEEDKPTFKYDLYSTIGSTERTVDFSTASTDAYKTFEDTSTEKAVILRCYEKVCEKSSPPEAFQVAGVSSIPLDITTRRKLRRLCWETMFGQELTKLTVMDLVLTVVSTLGMDFFRAVFVRLMNNCWCWDLEKQFPQYGDFKIAENILHLVNNQGMVWMGMFFSPGLAALNLIKLGILMYLRSWAVLTCNVPHEVVFRASRSNNFYLALLLTMLFLCVLPVGYALVWVEPSWHCGPFSGYLRIYHLATQSLKDTLPKSFHRCMDYVASPGIIIPLIVLMALIIYYMISLTGSLREANNDLKVQLRQERTEERRKMFRIADKWQEVPENALARWKKILPVLPSSKSAEASSKGVVENVLMEWKGRKRSTTSDAGEGTDVEQDSLPQDPGLNQQGRGKEVPKKPRSLTGSSNVRQTAICRSFSSGSVKGCGDSFESHSSEYGVIPKIKISGTEGEKTSYCSGASPEVVSLASETPSPSGQDRKPSA